MTAQMKKQQVSFIQKWDLKPIALIGFMTWALSWVLWFVGATDFTNSVFIVLAWCSVSILWLSPWKSKRQSNVLRVFTHGVGAMIAFRLFWDFWHWLHLNSQWYHETIFFTGKVAITFIFLSLACTPLITLFGWSPLNALKKPLGNWGFGFALLHLLLFTRSGMR